MFRSKVLIIIVVSVMVLLLSGGLVARAADSKPAWQVEWEKTLKAAETEGGVAIYVVDYPKFTVERFQNAYPKIKLSVVDGPSGPDLSSRLMAERRAGKYQADLYIAGQGTHVSVLYPAKALAPMAPAFILPEVKDESKWFKGKHRFIDPESNRSFVFQGHRGLYISYNIHRVKADDIKSWWDLTQSKWKGQIVGYDPSIAGTARNALWFMYKNPDFPGGEFNFNSFFKDLGIDVGTGLRLDIGFFLIRLDYALKVHNPTPEPVNAEAQYRYFYGWSWKYLVGGVLQFGVAYPF